MKVHCETHPGRRHWTKHLLSRTVKQKLFEEGVSAATAFCGSLETYYCPICEAGFRVEALSDGILTLEHVPPRSKGGKGIILTCRSCNNAAGHTIDAAAANKELLEHFHRTFFRQCEGPAGRAVLDIAGKKLNVDVEFDGSYVAFKVLREANNPAVVGQVVEQMKRLIKVREWKGQTLKVTARSQYNRRLAKVSDLRSAFLVCTAALGYSFAFSSSLKSVRAQIKNPFDEVLAPWSLNIGNDSFNRRIAVAEGEGVIVVSLGQGSVLLPWPPRGESRFLDLLAAGTQGRQFRFTAVELVWPKSFVAAIDRN